LHCYDRRADIKHLKEAVFILPHDFRDFSPSTLALLILGLWCGRISWRRKHVEKEAIYLMADRKQSRAVTGKGQASILAPKTQPQ
jgi:hypothetical protein